MNQLKEIGGDLYHLYAKKRKLIVFTMAFGVMAHFVILAEYLFNHDSIYTVTSDCSFLLLQGKWFANVISNIKGAYAPHYLSGILGIVAIGLSTPIVAEVLKVKSKFEEKIIASLLVVTPSVMVSLAYNGLDYFAITAYMSILSTFFAIRKNIWGSILSIIALTISIGSYQAYIGFSCAIFCYICMQKCMDRTKKIRDVVREGLYYVFIVVTSTVLYYIILKLVLYVKKVELVSYKGIDNMSSILQPSVLLKSVVDAYKNSFSFLWNSCLEPHHFRTIFLYRLFLVFVVTVILSHVIKMVKEKQRLRAVLFFVLSLVIFPLAVNIIGVLARNESFYYITVWPMVFLFICGFLLLNGELSFPAWFNMFRRIMAICTIISIIANMFITNNVQYEKGRYIAVQYESRFTELITRIRSQEGYSIEMPVVLAGEPPYDFLTTAGVSSMLEGEMMTGFGYAKSMLYNPGIVIAYLNNALSVNMSFVSLDQIDNKHKTDLDSMQIYPRYNSIKIYDGIVFVKLSEKY